MLGGLPGRGLGQFHAALGGARAHLFPSLGTHGVALFWCHGRLHRCRAAHHGHFGHAFGHHGHAFRHFRHLGHGRHAFRHAGLGPGRGLGQFHTLFGGPLAQLLVAALALGHGVGPALLHGGACGIRGRGRRGGAGLGGGLGRGLLRQGGRHGQRQRGGGGQGQESGPVDHRVAPQMSVAEGGLCG
ncbi:hypothetical protein F2Q65_15070 [Thiohalocapsa marina]|uniref:Uncharacterized protein n=1 Tax=Thiohalocapsa marina TaxID=424902 RepID=A0A5M8FGV1_9GAMM|nr:hypothetical protein F2Q65_15070 [Thiohalocapsa marina]